MTFFQTIAVALSMYSAVPTPQFEWNERNMRFAMCAFPLVGVITGGLMWLAYLICSALKVSELIFGFVMLFIPILVTGGIHLDGFCDTGDAIASHATREKKLEIMKDPHVGSFAVVKIVCLLICTFALWASLGEYDPLPIWISFILSRSLSGLAIATFPMAKNTGLAHTFSQAADKKRSAIILTIFALVCGVAMVITGIHGTVMAVMALLVFLFYRLWSQHVFGGITGDLAGWFLQICELMMLAALVICEYVEALL